MINSPKIQAIVNDFVAQLAAALAEESSAAIQAALVGVVSGAAATAGTAPRGKPGPKPRISSAAPVRAKGAKRAPEDLEAQTNELLAYIKKHPGQRIEQISSALKTSTKELVLPIRKLLAAKSIGKKGAKRATTYTAR